MWFLKFCLCLVCFCCISWSILFFCGPVIVKWFILYYSEERLVPTNIKVSPNFDINIGRVDFVMDDVTSVGGVSGFSRSVRVSWSLVETKPFLSLQAGPTFLENVFVADTLSLRSLPFSEINFEELLFELEVAELGTDQFGSVEKVKVLGTFNKDQNKLENLSSEFITISAQDPNLWAVESVKAEVDEIGLKLPLFYQHLTGTFSADQISSTRYGLDTTALKSNFVIQGRRLEFEGNIKDLGLQKPDGEIENINVDGDYDFNNFLWNAQLGLTSGFFRGGSFEFSSLTTNLSKINSEKYQAIVEADLKNFEISSQDQYLATVPPTKVNGKFALDSSSVAVKGKTKLRVQDPNYTELSGGLQISAEFDQSMAIYDCLQKLCGPSELLLEYELNLDEESISGQSLCNRAPCTLSKMTSVIETSHTGKVFQTLSIRKIVNPIILAYLYSYIASGEAQGLGHKIKFN